MWYTSEVSQHESTFMLWKSEYENIWDGEDIQFDD